MGPSFAKSTDRDWLVIGEYSLAIPNAVAPSALTPDGIEFYRGFAEVIIYLLILNG